MERSNYLRQENNYSGFMTKTILITCQSRGLSMRWASPASLFCCGHIHTRGRDRWNLWTLTKSWMWNWLVMASIKSLNHELWCHPKQPFLEMELPPADFTSATLWWCRSSKVSTHLKRSEVLVVLVLVLKLYFWLLSHKLNSPKKIQKLFNITNLKLFFFGYCPTNIWRKHKGPQKANLYSQEDSFSVVMSPKSIKQLCSVLFLEEWPTIGPAHFLHGCYW